MIDSSKFLEDKMIDNEVANKQQLDVADRDNLLLRKAIQDLEIEVGTKRKEIDDLIMIISNL
jgi:hypothetical protein